MLGLNKQETFSVNLFGRHSSEILLANMVKKVKCQVEGCVSGEPDGDGRPQPFYTDEECKTVAERTAELAEHRNSIHTLAVETVKADAAKLEAEANKIRAETERDRASGDNRVRLGSHSGEKRAPMSRPVVEENSTESDWSFFLAKWTRCMEATGVAGDSMIRHLWQACGDGLRRSLHNAGAREVSDVDILLSKIKSLAVKRQNNLVNVMALQGLSQERDEGMQSFLARLKSQRPGGTLRPQCRLPQVWVWDQCLLQGEVQGAAAHQGAA